MRSFSVFKSGIIFILVFAVFVPVLRSGVCFAQQDGLPDRQAGKEEESLFVAQKAFDDGFYDVALSLLERFEKIIPTQINSPK